jgi:hypothetical protein
MSWRDFQLKQQGFFKRENELFKQQWEQTRFISYYSALGFLKKHVRMNDLVTFPWEKQDVKLPTEEEMRYWVLKYGKTTEMN